MQMAVISNIVWNTLHSSGHLPQKGSAKNENTLLSNQICMAVCPELAKGSVKSSASIGTGLSFNSEYP